MLLFNGRHRAANWFWICCAAVFACSVIGCEGESPDHPQAAPLADVCIDEDGDGYGVGCALGPDCDDHDPTVHDNCPLARDEADGECDDGDQESCKVILGTNNGVTDCFVGVRTCVDGAWSSCGDASS